MAWWNKLKQGVTADDPAGQVQQQQTQTQQGGPKSHEELAEEAMAQLLAMSLIKPCGDDLQLGMETETGDDEASAGAALTAGANEDGGVEGAGCTPVAATVAVESPRQQRQLEPPTTTTAPGNPGHITGINNINIPIVAQPAIISQAPRPLAPLQISTAPGCTPATTSGTTSTAPPSAPVHTAPGVVEPSITPHQQHFQLHTDPNYSYSPRADQDLDSGPSTPTTVVTDVSSPSFDRRSRAFSSVSAATSVSDSCISPPQSARASLRPSDCAPISAASTPCSDQGLSSSPCLSPSPSSQPRLPQASPRSRRTCSLLINRSQPALHAARANRAATISSASGLQRNSPTPPPDHRSRPSVALSISSADSNTADQPPGSNLTKMDNKWINVQQKTFTKWLNTKIQQRDVVVKDLVTDLSDGVVLIHLLECLSQESLGRYASKPKMRVQKFENANTALLFVKSKGIQMTNIGAEDVVDGNRKIILGLIWTLILRFTISDINEEGMTAKEGLLLWCQRKTACYDEVEVRDFSASWNNGLAFCALLDIHRPDLIDYDALDKNDHRGNMQLAFDIAHKEIGIPDLLDVEDVCDVAKPDERSLMTYIAYWFHAFSQMEKVENAGRRVEKFVNNMQGAWEMQSAYERRMAALLAQIRDQIDSWDDAEFEGTYADAKQQAADFAAHKRGKKREWVAERSELATLLGNIKTKLGTYRLRPYEPPAELGGETLDREWTTLTSSEMKHGQLINETIRDIKNALRKSFADKANDFALALNTMQVAISGLEGDVEDQLLHVRRLRDNLPPLDAYLEKIRATDEKCQEANIEENDFTTYTYDELTYELGLVKTSVQKKLVFLENQIVARDMTNLTPIQLEEFESVFRHFDRDDSNSLSEIEFSAALASLGLVFSEDEMHDYFLETSNGRDRVTFEQFIRFMVSVTEDQNTAEQVYQSFREVADGKPYVTEMDLRHSLVPDEVIEKLLEIVPPHDGPDMQQDRGQPQYDYIAFMERLMGGGGALQDSSNGRTSPAKVNGNH